MPGLWLTEGGQSAAGSLIDYVIEDSSAFNDIAYEAERKETTVDCSSYSPGWSAVATSST